MNTFLSAGYTRVVVSVAMISLFLLLYASREVWANPDATGCGGATVAATNAAFEAEVVALVNQRRAEADLPPLKLVEELTAVARYHAVDMVDDDYFAHNTHDREGETLTVICSWSQRIRSYYANARTIGENIASGYRSPASVMEGWMDSAGHRENILGDFVEIGVGYHNNRWVQDFGTRRDTLAVIINGEAIETDSTAVTVYVHGSGTELRLRNAVGDWDMWQPFQNELSWTLADRAGRRTVEVEVRSGSVTLTGSDVIELVGAPEATPTPAPTIGPTPVPTPTLTPGSPQGFSERIYLPVVTR